MHTTLTASAPQCSCSAAPSFGKCETPPSQWSRCNIGGGHPVFDPTLMISPVYRLPVCDLRDVLLDNHRGRASHTQTIGRGIKVRLAASLAFGGMESPRSCPHPSWRGWLSQGTVCSPQLSQPIVIQDMTVVPANGWLEFKANLVESSPRV